VLRIEAETAAHANDRHGHTLDTWLVVANVAAPSTRMAMNAMLNTVVVAETRNEEEAKRECACRNERQDGCAYFVMNRMQYNNLSTPYTTHNHTRSVFAHRRRVGLHADCRQRQ